MPFMALLLVFMLVVVVWVFFSLSPHGVDMRKVMLFNAATLVAALLAGVVVGMWLFNAAEIAKASHKGMAGYLAIMAGGTAFLIVMVAAGVVRNQLLFPLSARKPTAAEPHDTA